MAVIDKLRTALNERYRIARATKGGERHSIKVILNWASTLNDAGNH